MAPRPGLEPGTNGLTVELTLRFHWCKLKNFKGIFHSNSPSLQDPILSRNSPMIHCKNCTRTYGFCVPESQPWQGIMANRTMTRTRTGSEIEIQELQLCRSCPDSPRLSPPGWRWVLHSQVKILPETGILADSR